MRAKGRRRPPAYESGVGCSVAVALLPARARSSWRSVLHRTPTGVRSGARHPRHPASRWPDNVAGAIASVALARRLLCTRHRSGARYVGRAVRGSERCLAVIPACPCVAGRSARAHRASPSHCGSPWRRLRRRRGTCRGGCDGRRAVGTPRSRTRGLAPTGTQPRTTASR